MKNRILEFDLMRSIAIFTILIYHLPGYSFNFYNLNTVGINIDLSVFREFSKYFGLGLFVFISGYLSNLRGRKFSSASSVRKYLSNKFIKIFPLYYLALILFCYVYEVNEPLRLTVHILGLQLVFASQLVKPAPTLWFIGLMLVYYAIYMFVKAEKINDSFKVLTLALFPIIIFVVNRIFGIMDLRIVLYYGIFLLGLYGRRYDVFRRISWVQTITVALIFAVFLIIYDDYTFATNPFSSLNSFLIVNVLMVIFIGLTYKTCLTQFRF